MIQEDYKFYLTYNSINYTVVLDGKLTVCLLIL